MSGTLFVVSTPIGNLGDVTYRAVEVLSSVAAVLAEDTRHSRRLLDAYEIRTTYSSRARTPLSPAAFEILMKVDGGGAVLGDLAARLPAESLDALAQGAGVSAAQAKADWDKGMIPGFTLVDSGVLAVHRAQEKGKCTYCFAG